MSQTEGLAEAERIAYRQRLDVFLPSRESANTLTMDALRAGIRLQTVICAAADVAHYADEALAIVQDEYRPRLDCRAGCSYCCCKPGVLVSVPDLLRIVDHIGSAFSADAAAAVGERARRYASQMEGRGLSEYVGESVPCPLLVDGRCSVYDIRPLVCRGYNSTNVDRCRQAHLDPEALVPIFSVLKDVTDGAMVGAAQGLKAAGFNDALVDLGTGLNIALSANDRFTAAVVAGDTLLATAENASWADDMWARVCDIARQVGIEPSPSG